MAKKIFITGATGYIGQKLALYLANDGHCIHALVQNLEKGNALLQHPNINLFQGSILDIATISKAMQGCDEAYHLAALASVWNKDSTLFEQVNVGGLNNVLDCCLETNLKNIVFTSTAGVVGHSVNNEPVSETTNSNPRLETLYERSKVKAELILKSYVDRGLKAIIVNPSRVYGPGLFTESNGFSRLIKMYLAGKWKIIPCNGDGIGNYVYIDDVINGLTLAMDHAKPGERYLLGGDDISYNEFFSTLEKLSGVHKPLYKVPFSVLMFLAHIQLAVANTAGRPPLITPP
ncbi:MAG: NAD-dependent epimerase/dehydratase family protein, partial [Pyrinomonadaceae bacterium]|nr:NAD-dependent epimerase/dehydratase family protein [Sphingobacteriaceae bacterium]